MHTLLHHSRNTPSHAVTLGASQLGIAKYVCTDFPPMMICIVVQNGSLIHDEILAYMHAQNFSRYLQHQLIPKIS
jgi:hypothetical protein